MDELERHKPWRRMTCSFMGAAARAGTIQASADNTVAVTIPSRLAVPRPEFATALPDMMGRLILQPHPVNAELIEPTASPGLEWFSKVISGWRYEGRAAFMFRAGAGEVRRAVSRGESRFP
jgi:hypothetical protein